MQRTVAERLGSLVSRYEIDDELVFGLDVGLASIGSAVVRYAGSGEIAFAGSRCFEPPEDPKTKELTNKTRRDNRLLRRVISRRAGRMADVRSLLHENGVLPSTQAGGFHHRAGCPDPWAARAEGLDRLLTTDELAVVLIHIAKHRGFKSNRKSERGGNAPDDAGRMLAAIAENRELSARYRTVGEMVARDPKFAGCKRNRSGGYTHTLARDDLSREVIALFDAQRRLGNEHATAGLEADYLAIAFHQRPLQSVEGLVGSCGFEPSELRAPRQAPSFERFRVLAKLVTIRVKMADGAARRLKPEELSLAISDFGSQRSLTWNVLAKKIGLSSGTNFDGIDEAKAKRDCVSSLGCMYGSAAIREAIGPTAWASLQSKASLLDDVARILAFREDIGLIDEGLSQLDIPAAVRTALSQAVKQGKFARFSGAGHISTKAARNLIPHLLDAKVYSEACTLAGYDHARARAVNLDDIRNPVVRRSLREALKQVETLVHEFGARPARIVVELARDVGKSAEERGKITRGIEKRTAEKRRHADELMDLLKLSDPPSDEDLRRYELWCAQQYRCIYTDQPIDPRDILSDRNAAQVDHVLPRSRSQDNSFHNQVLCLASANQQKGQRTPWEWMVRDGNDPQAWQEFEARVNALKLKGLKRRNLLMSNFEERQSQFVERNLNDTKYAARVLLSALRELYPEEPAPDPSNVAKPRRRLFARSGTVTALLRRAWGLDVLKDRSDDRHHALDALVCAAASQEWLLQKLTAEYQRQEAENRKEWVPSVPYPWPGFRTDAEEAYDSVFVSRSERRRGRGQGHKDTIYRIGEEDGKRVTYERKAVAALTKADLSRIRDPEANGRIVQALEAWLEAGKPAGDPPRSPKGDVIRKVRLRRRGDAGFQLNGGHVDNPDMVRVDVFQRDGKFYLVPVYRHQVMNKERWAAPPSRAIVAYKPESKWTEIDGSFEFKFSLYGDAFIEVTKRDGEVVSGYYRSTHRGTGAINISPHNNRDAMTSGIGARTLRDFRKFEVDRFGRKHEVVREQRTWHGVACT